jgi:succinoglycan biosynthesis transport protein ExoP
MLGQPNSGLPIHQRQLVQREDPRAQPAVSNPPFLIDAEAEASGLPISHYLWIIRRNALPIAGFVATVVLATVIVSARITPVYESTASVYVDRQEAKNIVGRDSDSPSSGSTFDSEQYLATQIRMIQSDSVVRPVAQRYNLLALEDQLTSDADKNAKAADAPILLKQMRVARPANTYLLQISYRSTDPQLSADVANGIAASYLDHTYNIRTRSSVSLSRYMEKQIEELRAKMEESQAKLGQLERELNVVDSAEDKANTLSRRLMDLNADYAKAQTELARAKASYGAFRGGTLDAVLLAPQADSLKRLVDRRNDQNEKFAEVKVHFGPNHPEYRKLAAQVKTLDDQVESTRGQIVRQAELELEAATAREAMIKKNFDEAKTESDRLNLRSFDYRRAKQEADADKRLYDELVRKIREAGINSSFQNNVVRISDAARPAWKPVFPDMKLNIGLALLLSIIVGIGAAIFSDALDNTLRDPEHVTRSLNANLLGTLPSVRDVKELRIPMASDPSLPATLAAGQDRTFSIYGEAMRTLRSSMMLMDFDRRVRTLLMSSATASEGKSTIAGHLATIHASQNKRTLLVDCDLRRPSQHKIFGIENKVGMTNVLNGELAWRDAIITSSANPNLHIISAGPPSRRAADLLGATVSELIEEMGKEYDLIILDAPPLLGFAESLQIAAAADGVMIVVRAGQTSRKAVGAAIQTLTQMNANVLGVVLNEVKKHHSDHYYYYGYYGKYYKSYGTEKA